MFPARQQNLRAHLTALAPQPTALAYLHGLSLHALHNTYAAWAQNVSTAIFLFQVDLGVIAAKNTQRAVWY